MSALLQFRFLLLCLKIHFILLSSISKFFLLPRPLSDNFSLPFWKLNIYQSIIHTLSIFYRLQMHYIAHIITMNCLQWIQLCNLTMHCWGVQLFGLATRGNLLFWRKLNQTNDISWLIMSSGWKRHPWLLVYIDYFYYMIIVESKNNEMGKVNNINVRIIV